MTGQSSAKFFQLKEWLADSPTGLKGIEELETVWQTVGDFGLSTEKVQLDITLARGLSYYTGAIFEVKGPQNVQMGSISGGGRYDNLTGTFGLKDVSGVGISFGVDRIYDVMEELNLFPSASQTTTRVMITQFDAEAGRYALPLLKQIRAAGINAELYPDAGKLKKQLDYANQKNIPFVILIGSEEMLSGQLSLKNMRTGEQQKMNLEEVIAYLRSASVLE